MPHNAFAQTGLIPSNKERLTDGIYKANNIRNRRHDCLQHGLSCVSTVPCVNKRLTNRGDNLNDRVQQVHDCLQHLFACVVRVPRIGKRRCNGGNQVEDGLQQQLNIVQQFKTCAVRPDRHKCLTDSGNHVFQRRKSVLCAFNGLLSVLRPRILKYFPEVSEPLRCLIFCCGIIRIKLRCARVGRVIAVIG